jgi:hypothetical protein
MNRRTLITIGVVFLAAVLLTVGVVVFSQNVATAPIVQESAAIGTCITSDGTTTQQASSTCLAQAGSEWYASDELGFGVLLTQLANRADAGAVTETLPVSQDPNFIGAPDQVSKPRYECHLSNGVADAISAGAEEKRLRSYLRICPRDRGGSVLFVE